MIVISKGAIHSFIEKHSNATNSLNVWYDKCKNATWRKYSDIKLTFNSIDSIRNDRYVFDIAGNHYRLVAMIHFDIRTVYIRAILTHQEYDYLNKLNKLNTL
ncbi:MAG: type II toxin-antitoxin system HigB family toxin [Saprospiraceae bacterium]